jgi:hypothetical protein
MEVADGGLDYLAGADGILAGPAQPVARPVLLHTAAGQFVENRAARSVIDFDCRFAETAAA